MRAPRLFHEQTLNAGAEILLTHDRAHYLRNVMRLRKGDEVRLFNSTDGEWRSEIKSLERREVALEIKELRIEPAVEDGPELFFAPLKRHRMELLIEKSVELGVSRLHPVLTTHTVIERINAGRLRSRVIEAAEQCERMTLPEMNDPIRLEELPSDRTVLMADEHGGGAPLLQALDAHPDAGFLIGPEGGFSLEERELLHGLPNIHPVTLGRTILRAETASIFMLSVWRAWADDELIED